MAKPERFEDLDKDELVRSAIEDFAVDLSDDEKKSKKNVIAALVESNIVWTDYVAQHPEVAPEPVPEAVVTSNAPSHGTVGNDREEVVTPGDFDSAVEHTETTEIHVAKPVVDAVAPSDKYLLKMVRENELYQTRGYTFTVEHPYALVEAVDAQWILENEDGFRQAFPAELQDFYG